VPKGTVREIWKRGLGILPHAPFLVPPNFLENILVGENQCYQRIHDTSFAHKKKREKRSRQPILRPDLRVKKEGREWGSFFSAQKWTQIKTFAFYRLPVPENVFKYGEKEF
jgi:hypothetical protein